MTRFVSPQVSHSDSGTEYYNNAVKELAKEFGNYRSFILHYHPHSNPADAHLNRLARNRPLGMNNLNGT